MIKPDKDRELLYQECKATILANHLIEMRHFIDVHGKLREPGATQHTFAEAVLNASLSGDSSPNNVEIAKKLGVQGALQVLSQVKRKDFDAYLEDINAKKQMREKDLISKFSMFAPPLSPLSSHVNKQISDAENQKMQSNAITEHEKPSNK